MMKRKLRSMAVLWPVVFLCLQAHGQPPEPPDSITPLQIGDTIPEYLWHLPLQVVNHPDGKDTIKLNDYRGKLIILDFWSTWCGSCLAGFPKMDSLGATYPEELAIVLVNTRPEEDTPVRVAAVIGRLESRAGFRLSLPNVLGDTALAETFPHRTIPHYVWIDPEGEVAAVTRASEVTNSNIGHFLRTGAASVRMKKEMGETDRDIPLFARLGQHGFDTRVNYSALITGYVEGLSGRGSVAHGNGNTRHFQYNVPLTALYNGAFGQERGNLPINQLVFEIPDSTGFRSGYLRIPDYGNLFCYELLAPTSDRDRLRQMLRDDLRRHFGVEVVRSARLMTVYELRRGSGFDNLRSTREEHVTTRDGRITGMRGVPVSYLIRTLNNRVPVPIAAGGTFTGNIDVDLPEDLEKLTPAQLQDWLTGLGFSVTEKEREMEVAVFRPSGFLTTNKSLYP